MALRPSVTRLIQPRRSALVAVIAVLVLACSCARHAAPSAAHSYDPVGASTTVPANVALASASAGGRFATDDGSAALDLGRLRAGEEGGEVSSAGFVTKLVEATGHVWPSIGRAVSFPAVGAAGIVWLAGRLFSGQRPF